MEIRVHYDMNIDEVVEKYPIVTHILMRYGLGCSGCVISTAETIGEGIELNYNRKYIRRKSSIY